MSYIVTGAYVLAPINDPDQGKVMGQFLRGAILPDEVPADHIKHLLDVDLIAEGDDPDAVDPFPAPHTVNALGGAEGDPHGGEPPGGSTPAKSAAKADWVEYAEAQGMDRDEAEALTKDDLIARFG